MFKVIKHTVSLILAINVLLFSAGVSMVHYYCGNCTHNHKEVLFPVEHLTHNHADGHCLLTGEKHNHEHHAEHKYFKLKNLQITAKKSIQLKAPVLAMLFEKTLMLEKIISQREVKYDNTSIPGPPNIRHTTSILLL